VAINSTAALTANVVWRILFTMFRLLSLFAAHDAALAECLIHRLVLNAVRLKFALQWQFALQRLDH